MSIEAVTNHLESKRIEGVANESHFGTSWQPNVLLPHQLPAAVFLIDDTYVEQARPIGFAERTVRAVIYFRLFFLIAHSGEHWEPDRLAQVPMWLDRVIKMFHGDWDFGALLVEPLRFETMQAGFVDWSGELFVGFQQRIRFAISVDTTPEDD